MSKLKSFTLILGVLIMSFLVGYLVFAWVEPTGAPPTGNVAAPINVGSTYQAKVGAGIGAASFTDSDAPSYYLDPASSGYAALFKGSVGIGDTTPASLFTVGNGDLFQINTSGQVIAGSWRGTAVGTQYGGTGQNWSAVSRGSIPFFSAAGTMSTLAPGTSGYFLKAQGTGADPVWEAVGGGTVKSITAGTGLTASPINPITDSGTLSVIYGSAAGTAAEGNKTITVSAGTGLTGGGNPITIGAGGSTTLSLNTAGISACTDPTTNKIYWDSTKLVCGTDQSGGFTCSPSCSTNYLAKFTDTSTIGISQIFDNGTNVGIGTATPSSSYKLDVQAGAINGIQVTSTGTTGVYGTGSSYGVRGVGSYGVEGMGSISGAYGYSDGSGGGVHGEGYQHGVMGVGVQNGVWGSSAGGGGTGVYGTGDYGVWGESTAASGGAYYGVYGSGPYGVYGTGTDTGVYGTGTSYGVYGSGPSGVYGRGTDTGVYGIGTETGVQGTGLSGVVGTGTDYGVYGSGTYGVYGTGGYGVVGTGTNYGVYGSGPSGGGVRGSGNSIGLYGSSNGVNGYGVYGTSSGNFSTGVYGSGTNYGVYAKSSVIALYVAGTTYTTGNLTVGGGSGKIEAGTIDPVFDIDGKKYVTYMADFAGGTRSETSGTIQLITDSLQSKTAIDFDGLEKGSNLWLFWQTSNKNINDVALLLTPGFEGKAWYEKKGNEIIIYGDRAGEVSYRLSAPRVDYQEWGNLANNQSLEGINISNY